MTHVRWPGRPRHYEHYDIRGFAFLSKRTCDALYTAILRQENFAEISVLLADDFTTYRGCGLKTRRELRSFLANLRKNHP